MENEETIGHFGFHIACGSREPHATDPSVQIYVMSSALSRTADLAISPHLMSAREIDQFIDEAVADLQAIRIDAKNALAEANR